MDNNMIDMTGNVSQDDKNLGLIIWIATFFLSFIPGLIFYLVKKDSAYVQDQAKEALNWSITAAIGFIAGTILMIILIGGLVVAAVWIANLVFCIMGAIATSKGAPFRVPFAIRLIK
jgi:uncharacterized protein